MSTVSHALKILGWPLRMVLLTLIRGYQRLISPMLPPTCKYYPSCSSYAVGAVQEHGAVKGGLLFGWRLMRCNPWSKGGFDPVPSHGSWRPDVLPDGRPRIDPSHARHGDAAQTTSKGA